MTQRRHKLVGNGYTETLGDPSAVGGFAGALIQIGGLAIAVAAGIVAARRRANSRAWSRRGLREAP